MNAIKSVLHKNDYNEKVPIWELEFHPWQRFTDKLFKVGIEFQKLSEKEKEIQIGVNAEVIAEVSKKLHFSAVTAPGGYWETAPGCPAFYWLPPEYRWKQISLIRKMLSPDIMTVAITGGVMAIPNASEYVEFSYKLFDAPEEVDKIARKILDNGIEVMRKAKDAGCDIVVTASDIADSKGSFFSNEQLDRFVLPYLREWVDTVHINGLMSIMHTDGQITHLIEKICNTGIQGIQAIDTVAGMKMAEALEICNNRVALCGNVDCGNLLAGTPESVYYETKSILKSCASFKRWILGASNAVQFEVPRENYEAMIKAWSDF
jgi:uroporphyrinogen-III decarboxylase